MSDLILVRYADQLRHPRWQRKRLEILKRDGFACARCSESERELHVHHKHYRRGAMAWEYENDELETLCCDCHGSEHREPSMFEVVPDTLRSDLSEAVRRGDFEVAQRLTLQAFGMVSG